MDGKRSFRLAMCSSALSASLFLISCSNGPSSGGSSQAGLPGPSDQNAAPIGSETQPTVPAPPVSGANPLSLDAAGTLVFASNSSNAGTELWTYTPSDGTNRVFDLVPGPAGSSPQRFTTLDGSVYFTTGNHDIGYALWRWDDPSTEPVNIHTEGFLAINTLVTCADRLYFFASDAAHGWEPWSYDPATDTAALLYDTWMGTHDGVFSASSMIALGDTLYFAAAKPFSGAALWSHNASSGITTILRDLTSYSYDPRHLAAYHGKLYFSAYRGSAYLDAVGWELFSYDPATGTFSLAEDIVPGAESSNPDDLEACGDTLFFRSVGGLRAYDDLSGEALPVDPSGVLPGDPYGMTCIDGHLYFMAGTVPYGVPYDPEVHYERNTWTYDTSSDTLAEIMPEHFFITSNYALFEGRLLFTTVLDLTSYVPGVDDELCYYDETLGAPGRVFPVVEGDPTVYPTSYLPFP